MKTHRLYILLAAMMLIGLYSCKKDKKDSGIMGVWVNEYTYSETLKVRQTYQFNEDSTVLFTRAFVNANTKAVVGYNYKSTTNFSFDGTTLKESGLRIWGLNQSKVKPGEPYNDLNDLIEYLLVQSSNISSQTVQFNADKTTFTFVYPPCPPNAFCLAAAIYTKQ